MDARRAISDGVRRARSVWSAATTHSGASAVRTRLVAVSVLLVMSSSALLWILIASPSLMILPVSIVVLLLVVALFTTDEVRVNKVMTEKRTESLIRVDHFGFGEAMLVSLETSMPSGVHREYDIPRSRLTVRHSKNPRVEVTEWREEVYQVNAFGWVMGHSVEEWVAAEVWETLAGERG